MSNNTMSGYTMSDRNYEIIGEHDSQDQAWKNESYDCLDEEEEEVTSYSGVQDGSTVVGAQVGVGAQDGVVAGGIAQDGVVVVDQGTVQDVVAADQGTAQDGGGAQDYGVPAGPSAQDGVQDAGDDEEKDDEDDDDDSE